MAVQQHKCIYGLLYRNTYVHQCHAAIQSGLNYTNGIYVLARHQCGALHLTMKSSSIKMTV